MRLVEYNVVLYIPALPYMSEELAYVVPIEDLKWFGEEEEVYMFNLYVP